ncbi:MAG: hypothetical protein ACD_57C00404G0001 [uncultured bacterium]|nr:MAG: hypothetical protein ACD_57C00404G0001 [uncultured bacterium]
MIEKLVFLKNNHCLFYHIIGDYSKIVRTPSRLHTKVLTKKSATISEFLEFLFFGSGSRTTFELRLGINTIMRNFEIHPQFLPKYHENL